jgi:hypothetical protein
MTGSPNNIPASIGNNGPNLGWIILDLGSGNEMPNSHTFYVYASSSNAEDYEVFVSPTSTGFTSLGSGTDTSDESFSTPDEGSGTWRYIKIIGLSGGLPTPSDYAYGPDLDAVGYP